MGIKYFIKNPLENYQVEIMSLIPVFLFFGFILFIAIFLIYSHAKRKMSLQLFEHREKIGQQNFHLEKANQELKEYTEELKQQREEIKAQAESLETALKNLRELVEFKEGLVGMLVHDLKNPLNIILNHTENNLVLQSGSEMLNMVNNILDVQKYETTKMPIEYEIFQLNKVVEKSMSKINYLALQKGINIENLTSSEFSLFSDIELTERIYINLLINAIKYTPHYGKIMISAQLLANEKIKISITDNGPGIPEALKDRVFDKFTQIIAKKSGFTRSTGLGLTFCKLAVEAHEGKIGVESMVGEGTTFWLTMPGIYAKNSIITKDFKLMPPNHKISDSAFLELKPHLEQLKVLKVYEVSKIQKILHQLKLLNINEIDSILQALENAAFSVNQQEYDKLINLLESYQ